MSDFKIDGDLQKKYNNTGNSWQFTGMSSLNYPSMDIRLMLI